MTLASPSRFILLLLLASALGLIAFVAVYATGGLLFRALGFEPSIGKPLPWFDYLFVIPAGLLLWAKACTPAFGLAGLMITGVALISLYAMKLRSIIFFVIAGVAVGLMVVTWHNSFSFSDVLARVNDGILPAAVIGGGIAGYILCRIESSLILDMPQTQSGRKSDSN